MTLDLPPLNRSRYNEGNYLRRKESQWAPRTAPGIWAEAGCSPAASSPESRKKVIYFLPPLLNEPHCTIA